jgi:hypothetical protein
LTPLSLPLFPKNQTNQGTKSTSWRGSGRAPSRTRSTLCCPRAIPSSPRSCASARRRPSRPPGAACCRACSCAPSCWPSGRASTRCSRRTCARGRPAWPCCSGRGACHVASYPPCVGGTATRAIGGFFVPRTEDERELFGGGGAEGTKTDALPLCTRAPPLFPVVQLHTLTFTTTPSSTRSP